MSVVIFILGIIGLGFRALSVGLFWEIGIRHELNLVSLPFTVCLWVAVGITALSGSITSRADDSESEKAGRKVAEEFILPLVTFIVFGLIYLIMGGYRP